MNISNTINDTKTNRVYGLDVLRAFAILFVLIGHSFNHSKISPDIMPLGKLAILGVEIFFVLSGFLIGSIIMKLIDNSQFHSFSDVFTFWKRRWLRTLPLYFVALLVFIRFDYQSRHELLDYPAYFLFVQNFAYKIPEFFELSWSLAIEEHFYLWFPVAFLIWEKITKKSHLAIILTAVTFIIVSYIFRLAHPLFSDWNEYNGLIRMAVLARMDAIVFGVLIAAIKFYWHAGFNWIKLGTPITAILFVLLCVWWFANMPHLMESRALQVNLFTIQSILCALLLPWFDGVRSTDSGNNFFSLTSRLSYSLYLVHILVIIAVNTYLNYFGIFNQIYNNPFILYPLYFSLFYFVSWITYNMIEKPFLHLRDIPLTWQSVFKASWATVLAITVLIGFF